MTPNAEPLAALCACPLFKGQPALAKSALADPRCTEHRYEAGEFLCTEERFARALAVIVAGECEVTKRTPSGRRMPISRLEPGMLYGAAALFTAPARYEVRLRALTPLWAVFFPEALLGTDLFFGARRTGACLHPLPFGAHPLFAAPHRRAGRRPGRRKARLLFAFRRPAGRQKRLGV